MCVLQILPDIQLYAFVFELGLLAIHRPSHQENVFKVFNFIKIYV